MIIQLKALQHPSWLLSTIYLLIWLLYSVLSYYTINPGSTALLIFITIVETNFTTIFYCSAYPIPTSTNSTLLLLLVYGVFLYQFNIRDNYHFIYSLRDHIRNLLNLMMGNIVYLNITL